MFYYSLYGRGDRTGVIDKYELKKFSDTIIMSHINNSELVKEFLDYWELKYQEIPTLIPKRIVDVM
jgi:hypothetical protein